MSNVDHGARTAPLIQSDVSIRHEIPIGETRRISAEINVTNLFKQHSAVAYQEGVQTSGPISPTRPARFSGDPQIDWGMLLHAYNYVDGLNATGAFAGTESPLTLASRYGLPTVFRQARNLRLTLRFTF